MSVPALPALLALLVALGAGIGLLRLAPRLGLLDGTTGAERARKLQARPVPAVGGIALALALPFAQPGLAPPEWTALVALLCVGVIDDRRGLGPASKALLQGVALVPLCVGRPLPEGLADVALVFAAVNVANTFDNADGALLGVSAVGLGTAGSSALGAVLGLLPLNLFGGGPGGARGSGARLYLGDAGAFVLGLLLTRSSVGLASLWLPALDLARVVVLRLSAGESPFVGDRRHLAHRLLARGIAPPVTALLLALASLPAPLAAAWMRADGASGGAVFVGGLLLSTAGFALLLRLSAR